MTDLASNIRGTGRRGFMKQLSAGAAGLTLGSMNHPKEAKALFGLGNDKSEVSFVTGTDQREASYNALKPLKGDLEKAIGDKQVVIKINSGQVAKDLWLNATDPNTVRGILDFLKEFYDRDVIIAESTAASTTTFEGFENYGFMPLEKEYNAKFLNLNDVSTTTKWILNENHHPLAVNIIDTFLDPDVYMISATRIKSHNCVISTLSLKNIVMAAPINHYKQKKRQGRNEKPKMHQGGNRGLSYNMFLVAELGVQPDLAILDGVVGMEGNGPVRGTPVEQGVMLASADWVAADRIGVELMGVDYEEVKYLQWCAAAGMGNDDLEKIDINGPDYRDHIIKYKMHENIDQQRAWLIEDYDSIN